MKTLKDFLALVAVSAVSYIAVDTGFTLGKAICNEVKSGVKSCKNKKEEEKSEEVFE